MTEIVHKYTYPVVDLALRNFLMFVFVLMAIVAVAMAIQITFGVDVMAGSLPATPAQLGAGYAERGIGSAAL